MAGNKGNNDFDQGLYVEKVDSAHEKLKSLEGQVRHLQNITDAGLILKTIRRDNELRREIEGLIWSTIVSKSLQGFLYIVAAVILIPLLSKLFNVVVFKLFQVTL